MQNSSPDHEIRIRPARAADVGLIVNLIQELAEYERLRSTCRADAETLEAHLFGAAPCAEVVLAEVGRVDVDRAPAGFALFFPTFSTFECAPSLYLEDLFVRPAFRRRGIGQGLLTHLASLARARGCRRMEWAVLDWNRPALDFYQDLGAKPMDEWTVYRLEGEALQTLAEKGKAPGKNL